MAERVNTHQSTRKENAMKVHQVQVQIWATTVSEVIGELTPHPPTVKPKQTHTPTTTTVTTKHPNSYTWLHNKV